MRTRLSIVLTLLLLLSIPAFAQVTDYSDVAPGTAPIGGDPVPTSPPTTEGVLTFYTVLADFEMAAPGLPTEDFSNNLIGPGGVCGGSAFLNSTTSDACFAAGSVLPGFTLNPLIVSDPTVDYVLATTGFLGIGIDAVGPNTFTDNTELVFSPAVNAVGFDLVGDLVGPVTVDIEFFDELDQSLGTTSASGTIGGTFFGAVSPTPIARVEMIAQAPDGAELFGNLTFGAVASAPGGTLPIPTLGMAGLSLLLLLLAGAGVFVLRR